MEANRSSGTEPVFLSVVIPAFNEQQRIGASLREVCAWLKGREHSWEIVVVDDGSSDGTAQAVRELIPAEPSLRLLELSPNRGKGFAVRAGVLAARGEIILFSDADLSAPIEELDRLLAPLQNGFALAFGSRALKREWITVRQSARRELAGKCFNLALRLITGLNYSDTQCGFKAYRREAAQRIFPLQRIAGFGFDPEILFLARKLGFPAVEVPVHWAHREGSKVRVLRDGMRMVLDLARIRWNDLTGKYSS